MNKNTLLLSLSFLIICIVIPEQIPHSIIYTESLAIRLSFVLLLLAYWLVPFLILQSFRVSRNHSILISFIIGLSMIISVVFRLDQLNEKRLNSNGEKTFGIINSVESPGNKKYVRVKFHAGPNELQTFRERDYSGIKRNVGDTVSIIYWRPNPRLNKIVEFK